MGQPFPARLNPSGWVVLGAAAVRNAAVVGIDIYDSVKKLFGNNPDPYACPGQKSKSARGKIKRRRTIIGNQSQPQTANTLGRELRKCK